MADLAHQGRNTSGASRPWARWLRRPGDAWGATLFAVAVAGIMALPLATIVVLSLDVRESVWPHLMRTVLPGALADTGLLLPRRRRADARHRHRHRLAHHHVPLSRPRRARPPARAAARHADLHHRLLLRGAARLHRARSARAAGGVRLAHGQGLLVPRGALAHRRRAHPVGRALPLRVPLGARELRAAVGLRARGGAHAGAHLRRHLLVGRACRWRGRRSRPAWRWRSWSASTISAPCSISASRR